MSDKQLRDEVATLLTAGHETTSLALSWACYLLARHPEVAERICAEIHSPGCRKDFQKGRRATASNLR